MIVKSDWLKDKNNKNYFDSPRPDENESWKELYEAIEIGNFLLKSILINAESIFLTLFNEHIEECHELRQSQCVAQHLIDLFLNSSSIECRRRIHSSTRDWR